MRRLKAIAVMLAALAPAEPAAAQSLACALPSQPMLRAEMLFGRNIGGRPGVSGRDWGRFVAGEITPRFPAGVTVIDAAGQWRDTATGRVVRERSKIVVLIVADDAQAREGIDAIASSYKKRFRQQAVGIVTRPVCAAF